MTHKYEAYETKQMTPNNTGLTPKEHARIQKLIAKHSVTIAAAHAELATNYNVPAQRIINAACNDMGITRIDWEKIDAVQANTRFVRPPQHLLDRWARY